MLSSLEIALALKNTSLFASLPADDLLPVANLCVRETLDAGDVLFHEGDLGDGLYVVVHGSVAVERGDKVIAILGAGECVGEMAVLDWNPRSATVVAEEPTLLIRLDRHNLLDLLADHPKLADNLAAVLAARVRNLGAHTA